MPRSFLTVVAVLMASASVVAARPSTLSMTCAEATAMVAAGGSVLLSTGQYTFHRFAASNRFCAVGERAHFASAPTLDSPNCRLGYTCKRAAPRQSDDI